MSNPASSSSPSRLRICVVSYSYYETDNRVRRYAEALARQGHEVEAFALRAPGMPRSAVIDGVTVRRIQEKPRDGGKQGGFLTRTLLFVLRASVLVAASHLRRPFQLGHIHSPPDFVAFSALVPRLLGVPFILDIHDIVPEFYAEKFGVSKSALSFKALVGMERLCCRLASHVVVANDIWRGRLLTRSTRPDKATTILNFPDPRFFRQFRPKRKSDKFVLMYPGTMSWHQGLDVAIRGMARLAPARADVELHIYGDGPCEKDLRGLVEQLGLQKRVLFFAGLPLDQIPDKMIDADLGIIPKRARGFGGEAFSTKTLEFMALGVPILVSRTMIDQFYFDERTVTFFEPESDQDFAAKVLELAGNPSRREQVASNGLLFITRHNWGLRQTEYLKLVSGLCGRESATIASI
ncbi:MAG: glycosyltransferase family 4 protein [Limisphaerales bacterium]